MSLNGRYLLEAPLRRRWHVFLPAVLVAGAVMTLGLLGSPRYRASALVLGGWNAADEAELRSRGIEVSERRIRAVRERVMDGTTIARLLKRSPRDARDSASPLAGIEQWSRAVRVLPEGATAYRIECVTSDAATAALVVNLIATDLVEQTAGGSDSPQVFEVRLAEAVRRVERSKEALQAFRAGSAAPSGEAGGKPDDPWLAQVHEATLALAAARARAERLRDPEELTGSSAGPVARTAREELEQARTTLARLRERYTDEHPDVERLLARVRELEDAAAREPYPAGSNGDQASVQAEIATLTARLAALMQGPRGRSRSPAGTGAAPEGAQSVLSEYGAAVSAYEALLERSRSAEAAARLGRAPSVRFELLRPASVPDVPEPRGLALFALLGGGIGLLVGVATAVVAELRDDTVRGPEDLGRLGFLVLATIPLVRGRASRKSL